MAKKKEKKYPKYVRIGNTFYEKMSKEKVSKIFTAYMDMMDAPEISAFREYEGVPGLDNLITGIVRGTSNNMTIGVCPTGFAEPYHPVYNTVQPHTEIEKPYSETTAVIKQPPVALTAEEIDALLTPGSTVITENE